MIVLRESRIRKHSRFYFTNLRIFYVKEEKQFAREQNGNFLVFYLRVCFMKTDGGDGLYHLLYKLPLSQ